jgi:hypothetical protein
LGGVAGQMLRKKAESLNVEAIMQAADEAFYKTAFSEATETTVTPHNVLFKRLINKKVFPGNELINAKKKVHELWQS